MTSDRSSQEREKCKIVTWVWVSVSLAICCLVALIVLGVVIVQPVVETDSLSFQEANCTTVKNYFTGEKPSCSCGKYCQSWYPCVRYLVDYVPASGGNGTARRAVMFDTEAGLNNGRYRGEDRQCATRPCGGDRGDKELTKFNDTYGEGQTYKCLYNPSDPGFVILTRLFSWDAMFHSLLWPSIGLVVFAALTLYWGLRCKAFQSSVSGMECHTIGKNVAPPPNDGGFIYS
ncbi:calcium-activated potassium channel subunit beta-2-like [Branchiostoma floridae]|uniref:Calcium-activated potassium channel subunit beta-2-like n=1 Tax=Branchiostoma floridae TaxID=7739 RepID=A0A9J7KQD7_BRAFL|nr:calcium-activated potassium channel subunit beta-2-like [Branchiostoma floridae]